MQKERNDDKKKGKKLVTEEDIKALDEPENEKKGMVCPRAFDRAGKKGSKHEYFSFRHNFNNFHPKMRTEVEQ